MGTFQTRLSAGARFRALMAAWQRAPNDVDVEIKGGRVESGPDALLISFDGTDHMLTVPETLATLEILDDTILRFPKSSADEGIANLADGLRAALQALSTKAPTHD